MCACLARVLGCVANYVVSMLLPPIIIILFIWFWLFP